MMNDEQFHAVVNAIRFDDFTSVRGLMVKTGVPVKVINKALAKLDEFLEYDDQGRVAYENGTRDE